MTDHKSSGHGTVSTYIVGFVLAVILTVIPFWMAMTGTPNFAILVVFAVVQIIVHVVCFLHINSSPAQRWNLMTFVFAVITILIIVIGSVWVMENSMQNMMSDKQYNNMHNMHNMHQDMK
ncbi:cytochrome o ubiquinol oxidase subunit IV [Entomomonas moraniae]|nr:cytochrome o ubiquinol oxidase subunit IV [Entomomonas moraniae]